jgi:hypothetical protein
MFDVIETSMTSQDVDINDTVSSYLVQHMLAEQLIKVDSWHSAKKDKYRISIFATR